MELISFNYDYVRLSPSEQIGMHEGDSWELSYVIKGSGTRIIGTTSMPFTDGDLVMIPPHIPHCWYFSSDATDENGKISNITINFSDLVLEKTASAYPELTELLAKIKGISSAQAISGGQASDLIRIMKDMRLQSAAQRVSNFINILILLGELHDSQNVGSRQKLSKEEMRLNQVRIYVICNMERQISLDDVVRHVGMSRSAFCSFFKKTAGKSFISYLNDARLEKAKTLLMTTTLSVSEISARVGFSDVPYFHRVFHRKYGTSPQGFRKK